MTRRDVIALALLALVLAFGLWTNHQQQQQIGKALDGIGRQLDVREQERIGLLEARIVALEKTQARLRARIEYEHGTREK